MADDEPRLLMDALRHLSDEDRERVLVWLLQRMPASAEDLPSDFLIPHPEYMRRRGRQVALGEKGFQVVPMRFTAAEHARLRAWSEEHGFSMAAVVRGLVSRFLDGQPAAETQQGGHTESA